MSDALPPDPPPPPPAQRNGCLTAIMIVIGIILLLPGVCAVIILSSNAVRSVQDAGLVGGLLAIAAIGVAMIWWALTRRKP